MILTQEMIVAKISEYIDPYLQDNYIKTKAFKAATILADTVGIDIVLGYPAMHAKNTIIAALNAFLQPLDSSRKFQINISWKIDTHVGKRGIKSIANIKNIIAVASGKGGVGKSTVAVNLAMALSEEGARVGILDADIYGPSQPLMLGVNKVPETQDKKLLPVMSHNIQSMSMGYLIGENTPMIWRGPMVSMALQQLLNDTMWDDLDYLIIDLPPGTGDIQLTLSQKIPVSGAVIVTTPQDLALLDVRRAYEMFQKVDVPVLGIVENMSVHICTQCGHAEKIFGDGGGQRMATQYGVNLLGSLPLDMNIRMQTDNGVPLLIADPHGATSSQFREIARAVAAKLSLQDKDYSQKFPPVVVK